VDCFLGSLFVTHLIFNRMFLWDIHGSVPGLKESLVLPGKTVTYYSKCYCRVVDQDTLSQHCRFYEYEA
jgi:hypothetical protein